MPFGIVCSPPVYQFYQFYQFTSRSSLKSLAGRSTATTASRTTKMMMASRDSRAAHARMHRPDLRLLIACSLIVHIQYTHIHAFATGYSVVSTSMSFQMYCHCVYSDLNANVTLCRITAFSSAFFAGLMGVRTCYLNCYHNYSFAHIALKVNTITDHVHAASRPQATGCAGSQMLKTASLRSGAAAWVWTLNPLTTGGQPRLNDTQ